jgi:hypothetical protein
LEYILKWIQHLKTKGFGSQDPLFLRSKTHQGSDNLSFALSTDVEPKFWRGTGTIRELFQQRS